MRSLSSYLLLSVVGGDVERGVLGDRVHPPVGAALDQVGHHVAVTVLARLKQKYKFMNAESLGKFGLRRNP